MSRILICGAAGSQGRRFTAIVKYLGHIPLYLDIDTPKWPDRAKYDKCIIATPINNHLTDCLKCIHDKCDFLCEKPISKNIRDVEQIASLAQESGINAFMVSNWHYALYVHSGLYAKPNSLEYIEIDCYNTGKDGVWDYVQPLHLLKPDGSLAVLHNSPTLKVNTNIMYNLTRDSFEHSYVDMIEDFIAGNYGNLWTIKSTIEAHKRVIEWEAANGDPQQA